MADLVWISGASSGIGRALLDALPWPGARVIGVSRRPAPATEHLPLDLADPADWDRLGESFAAELAQFGGARAAFFHAAGTIDPVGFAAEMPPTAYRDNVLLNSASPQVLGQLFLRAVEAHRPPRSDLVMITSGAARTVYPGWSSYGAAKAAVDQWVRTVGAEEQARHGAAGVQVLSVAPGTVDTGMQALIRATPAEQFPSRQKFDDLHAAGNLTPAGEVAARMWRLLDAGFDSGSVVDLRDLA